MADETPVVVDEQKSEAIAATSETPKPKARARKKTASAKPVETTTRSEAPTSRPRRYSAEERSTILATVAKRVEGGKATVKDALKEAGISEQTYYNWKRNADQASVPDAAPAVQGDELKDLVALEAENLRLRKELADKLRAENAELRRRLGKA